MEAAIPIRRRGCLLGDEEDVDGGGVDLVKVGQRRHAGVGRVDAAVELGTSEEPVSRIPPTRTRRAKRGEGGGVGMRTRTVRPLKLPKTAEW